MSKVIEKLAAEGRLNPAQVERIGSNVADFMKAANADPALYEAALEKTSFPDMGGVGKAVGSVFEGIPWKPIVGTAAVGAGLELGARAIKGTYDAVKGSIDKARHYKQMMEHNEDLATKDPKIIQRAFNTLHKFNPGYASDPLVSGQFVRSVAETARLPLDSVNNIVNAHKNMRSGGQGSIFGNLPTNLVKWEDPELKQRQTTLYDQGQEDRQAKLEDLDRQRMHADEKHHEELMKRRAETGLFDEQAAAQAQQAAAHARQAAAYEESQRRRAEAFEKAQRARQLMYEGARPAFEAKSDPNQLNLPF